MREGNVIKCKWLKTVHLIRQNFVTSSYQSFLISSNKKWLCFHFVILLIIFHRRLLPVWFFCLPPKFIQSTPTGTTWPAFSSVPICYCNSRCSVELQSFMSIQNSMVFTSVMNLPIRVICVCVLGGGYWNRLEWSGIDCKITRVWSKMSKKRRRVELLWRGMYWTTSIFGWNQRT